MNTIEILDKAGTPLLIIIVYFLIYFYRKNIVNMTHKKNKLLEEVVNNSFDCFKFNFKIKWYKVGLPLITILIVDLIIIIKTKTFFDPYSEPLWFLIIGRSFLNPISEEILFRGFIVGMLFLTWVPIILRELFKFKTGYFYIIIILMIQSLYFGWIHGNYDFTSMLIRSSGGFIYGLFYILFNKNLYPATLAHVFHNILISIGYFNPT